MQEQANFPESLFQKAGDYLETRIELIKLQSLDKTSDVVSLFAAGLLVIIIATLAVTILSIGVAIWIGELLDKYYYGFFIVGGFYLILALIMLLFKKKLFVRPVANLFIDKVLN